MVGDDSGLGWQHLTVTPKTLQSGRDKREIQSHSDGM